MNDNKAATGGPQAEKPGRTKIPQGADKHGDRPDPDSEEEILDNAIEESFPASDPSAPSQPATGWIEEDEKEEPRKKD